MIDLGSFLSKVHKVNERERYSSITDRKSQFNVFWSSCFLVEAPRILGVLSADVNVDDTANLSCIVSSFPPSNVTWTFKGRKLPASLKYEFLDSTGTLRVKEVKFKDAGMYECTHVNELGEARANATLTVGCK